MYRQYGDVSKQIFDISKVDFDDMNTADKFKQTLNIRYADMLKNFSTGAGEKNKLMAKFLHNNEQFIQKNISQLAETFEAK